jgi:hypothetical protein
MATSRLPMETQRTALSVMASARSGEQRKTPPAGLKMGWRGSRTLVVCGTAQGTNKLTPHHPKGKPRHEMSKRGGVPAPLVDCE